jgi:hypothetical protein
MDAAIRDAESTLESSKRAVKDAQDERQEQVDSMQHGHAVALQQQQDNLRAAHQANIERLAEQHEQEVLDAQRRSIEAMRRFVATTGASAAAGAAVDAFDDASCCICSYRSRGFQRRLLPASLRTDAASFSSHCVPSSTPVLLDSTVRARDRQEIPPAKALERVRRATQDHPCQMPNVRDKEEKDASALAWPRGNAKADTKRSSVRSLMPHLPSCPLPLLLPPLLSTVFCLLPRSPCAIARMSFG